MSAPPPITFDRATGELSGAGAWERLAALALVSGSKVSSLFSHRGYNSCANLLRRTLPPRDIVVTLGPDAQFAFPYGDGYWSKLLNRSFRYEDELEVLFRDSAGIDYTLLDCGANYGYWSVLVSSRPFGSRKAIAIEPSGQNFPRLVKNDRRAARHGVFVRHQARGVLDRRRGRGRRRGSPGAGARQPARRRRDRG